MCPEQAWGVTMSKKRCSYLLAIGITVALPGIPPALADQACHAIGRVDDTQQMASGTIPRSREGTADKKVETAPDVRYRLRPGDVIELNFPFVPTFNDTITIQPDGYITLRALGGLRVDGLTVPELT